MLESVVSARNAVIGFCYRRILKPVFFLMDPEFIHNRFLGVGKFLGAGPFRKAFTRGLF